VSNNVQIRKPLKSWPATCIQYLWQWFSTHCETFGRPIAKQAARHRKKRLSLRGFTVSSRGGFMKKQLLALVGLGLLLATASASAQTVPLKANIPFNFIVNKAELPAGEYTLQSLGSSDTVMLIQSTDSQIAKMVSPNACASSKPLTASKLVFHRYGSEYFLAQIWTAGYEQGKELPKSSRETEVAQDYAVQNVVLAATLR
jgi:hypothetical protein